MSNKTITTRNALLQRAQKSHIPNLDEHSSPAFGTNNWLNLEQIQPFFNSSTKLCQVTVPEKPPYKLAELKHHGFDMKKRWYVEFSAWDVSKGALVRQRPTMDLNRIHNMQQRITQGELHVRVLNGQLRDGKVLGKDKIIVAPKPKRLTLLEAVDFVHDQKKLNGNRKNYTRTFTQLKNLLVKWLEFRKQPDYFIAEFDRTDAQTFLRWLQTEKKLANKTINNIFSNLSIVFTFIEKKVGQVWKQNPLAVIDALPVVVSKHAAYTDQQIKILRAAITDKAVNNKQSHRALGYHSLNLFIQFIYYTLARPKELMALKVCDIQLAENRMHIRGEESKNKIGDYVPLPDALQQEIRAAGIMNYPATYFVFGDRGTPSSEPVHANFFWHKHHLVLKATGLLEINPNFTLYSYKHSGAISLYKATKDVKLVQQQCRHQSVAQTDAYLRDLGLHSNYEQVKKWKGAF